MQSKENKIIDARPFVEIYANLSEPQRRELNRKCVIANLYSTRQTLWNWGTGKTQPGNALIGKSFAGILSRFLGCTVYFKTLFPLNPIAR